MLKRKESRDQDITEDKGSSGPEHRANSTKRGEENLHEGSTARQTFAGQGAFETLMEEIKSHNIARDAISRLKVARRGKSGIQ